MATCHASQCRSTREEGCEAFLQCWLTLHWTRQLAFHLAPGHWYVWWEAPPVCVTGCMKALWNQGTQVRSSSGASAPRSLSSAWHGLPLASISVSLQSFQDVKIPFIPSFDIRFRLHQDFSVEGIWVAVFFGALLHGAIGKTATLILFLNELAPS